MTEVIILIGVVGLGVIVAVMALPKGIDILYGNSRNVITSPF